jgi:hypothetical protein
MKCHGKVKKKFFSCGGIKTNKNKLLGFKEGDIVGYLETKVPVKKFFINFNLTFLIALFFLFLALIGTLYGFSNFIKLLKMILIFYWKFLIKKFQKAYMKH